MGPDRITLAVNLGIERARHGKRVILVDADPDQESLSDYIANRDEHGALPSVPVVQAKGSTTAKSLQALARDFDDVIVDCGGFDFDRITSSGPYKPRLGRTAESVTNANLDDA